MSPWAPDQAQVAHPPETEVDSGHPKKAPLMAPWWMRVVPFFLSAFLFLSAIFAVFSPLPLLLLHLRAGRPRAWLGIASNTILVGMAAGRWSMAIYLIFIGSLGLVVPELVKRRRSLEAAVGISLLAITLSGASFVSYYAFRHHINPVAEVKNEISAVVDSLGQAVSTESNLVSTSDVEDWKHNLLVEFPSAVAVFSLVLVWANLSLLLRANPGGVRERMGLDAAFLKKWKAPEWLVWPTIASGFCLLVNLGPVSDVSLNLFKFLMAVYAIQGLSILSFCFDLWNIRGVFRMLGFVISVFVMMPLLLSLGFFDLWFDFRAKFRQS